MTASSPRPDALADRLPVHAPGWWCWRCGWWKTEQPGEYRPDECGGCASWSRDRRIPTDTLVRALVTVELPS